MIIFICEVSDCVDVDIVVIIVFGGVLCFGQSWLDELIFIVKIVKSIVLMMMVNGFNGIFLVVINFCDIIIWQVWQFFGLLCSQVLGIGVWLDIICLCCLLVQELEIGVQSIDVFIFGEYGDIQFLVWLYFLVYGMLIVDFYQQCIGLLFDCEVMVDKVCKLGFEIYVGKGCIEYGVVGIIVEICCNIFIGSYCVLVVFCIFDGEYGVSGVVVGVLVVLVQGGVKQIIELQLVGEEQVKFSQLIVVIKVNIVCLF